DKKLNKTRIAKPQAAPYRVEGWQVQWASPYRTRPYVNYDDLAVSYKTERWWLTEDFEPNWIPSLWEVSPRGMMGYQPLTREPFPGFTLEKSERNSRPTNVLKMSHPNGSGPPLSLRMKRKILWHSFFLNYNYFPLSEDVDLSPLCLDFPDGVEMETVFESSEQFEKPNAWNQIRIEYLEYLKGTAWEFEIRRHINGSLQSTTRVKTGKMAPVIFELRSGTVLLDHISVGELSAKANSA
ncbi:MAG: hypothetical protein AAF585_28885, partial [Verrucomicrobiota bacterium]